MAISLLSKIGNRMRYFPILSKSSCSRFHFIESIPKGQLSPVVHKPCSVAVKLTSNDVKKVEIKACGNLYVQWKQERRFWKVPDDATTLSVTYQDTGNASAFRDDCPLVLIMPGSPGSFEDFSHITHGLRDQGVRVVIPSFPDLSVLKWGRFRHTPEEKCEYIKDFMKAIQVKRIDMLICHSSSLFPGVLLCNDKTSSVKALTILNPTGFKYPKVLNPLKLTNFVVRMAEFPIGHEACLLISSGLVKLKPTLKGDNLSGHILSAVNVHAAKAPQRITDFKQLLKREDFPLMLLFSENDGLISKAAMYDMAQLMIPKSDIQFHDAKGEIKKSGGTDSYRRVLAFEKGTHFVFKKHPHVVVNEIQSFLSRHFKKC